MKLLIVSVLLTTALAFRTFREEIPNGASVPDPCGSADGWPGVGHKYQYGSGERNPFGQAFANAGFGWTKELCQADSDQDGRTNGQELGDPKCVWKKGDKPARDATSHPGVCEPVASAKCKSVNFSGLNC